MSTVAATPSATTTPPAALHVHVTRFLRAPRERVFAAWTDAGQMKQWMGPANFTCIESESDLRAGGRYRLVMRGTPPPRNGEAPQERTSTVIRRIPRGPSSRVRTLQLEPRLVSRRREHRHRPFPRGKWRHAARTGA